MAAYIVARVDVQDWDKYREYMRHTPRIIARFGGKFVARGGEMTTLEGEPETLRLVLIEFPTLKQAKDFYDSPEYKRTKKLRDGAGAAQFVAIDGYPVEEWTKAAAESARLSLPA
jgi:uncharacterized protein (DUF1330 family)